MKNQRKQFYKLFFTLVLVVISVGVSTAYLFYQQALKMTEVQMNVLVQSQASLIESVAKFDQEFSDSDHPEGATGATLSQVISAFESFNQFGETGEFLIVRSDGEMLNFIVALSRHEHDYPEPIKINSNSVSAAFLAAAGEKGSGVSVDHHGDRVLAAYEYLPTLGVGIVVKQDLREIAAPYVQLALYGLVATIVLITLSMAVFYRVSQRVISKNLKDQKRSEDAEKVASLGHWELDVKKNQLFWSREVFRIFELDPEKHQPSYELFLERIHPEDREKVNTAYAYSIKNQTKYDIEHRLLLKDDRIKIVRERCETQFDKYGNPLVSTGTVQDITSYRESESFLSAVIEHNLDGVISISKNGEILQFNKAAEEIFGYPAGEVLGKKINRLIPSSERKKHGVFISELSEMVASEQADNRRRMLGRRKSGEEFPIEISISEIAYGNMVALTGIFRDLTVIEENRAKLEEQQQAMLRQSRHAQMGEMLSMIAHQWRQPLSTISALASDSLIKRELGDLSEEDLGLSLREITQHTQFLSQTIDDFRTFFSKDKTKELVNLWTVYENSQKVLSKALDKEGVEVQVFNELEHQTPVFPSELMQVFINILKNAYDALKEIPRDNRLIRVELKESGKQHMISFFNSGGNIPEEVMDKIYTPYFTTKQETSGTGLGLYMSKIIIEEHHNGTMEVSNHEDGVLIRILLPLE